MPEGQFRWLPSFRDLDEQQQRVIFNSLNKGNNLIYGPAGGGKTAILLYCAKTLQDTKKSFIIFLYTNTLQRFISAAIDDLKIPQITVRRFYQWVWATHVQYLGTPTDVGDDKYSKWVDNLILLENRSPGKLPHFDYILIDEAQDFKPNVARLLHMLADNLVIAGDTAQSLYTDVKDIQELALIWHPLTKEYELLNNYRNPKTIALVASIFLDGSSITVDEFLRSVKGKDYEMKPVWYQVNTGEEQAEKIVDLIEQTRGVERIGILVKHNAEITAIASYLNQRRLNYQIAVGNNANYDFSNSLPTLTTVQSAKGLEFDQVILPFLNANIWDDHKDNVNERRAFFVALTRAKNKLFLISKKGYECAYLKEIISADANLVQTPTPISSSKSVSQLVWDDDPF